LDPQFSESICNSIFKVFCVILKINCLHCFILLFFPESSSNFTLPSLPGDIVCHISPTQSEFSCCVHVNLLKRSLKATKLWTPSSQNPYAIAFSKYFLPNDFCRCFSILKFEPTWVLPHKKWKLHLYKFQPLYRYLKTKRSISI
jgi:hypothetical protein